MATRKETAERKVQLRRDLRAARQGGDLRAGEMATSHRALGQKYGLSPYTVAQELKKLAEEGVLHSVARVGTFAGAPVGAGEFYLLVTRDGSLNEAQFRQTQMGFEEAIARRGDAVLTLEKSEALARCQSGAMPAIVGVFDLAFWPGEPRLELPGQTIGARVGAAKNFEQRPGHDLVSFDDATGGRLATRHLLGRGHRRIAFLGVHSPRQDSGIVGWSAQREQGWREALQAEGLSDENLAFHPAQDALSLGVPQANGDCPDESGELRAALSQLIAMPGITAVVAANDCAALQLLQALRNARRPPQSWPAIVGFDNHPAAQGQLMTSLQLPYAELGRAAADLLWARRNDQLDETPQQRIVEMRLIARLTCHPDWARHAGYDASRLVNSTEAEFSGSSPNLPTSGTLATT